MRTYRLLVAAALATGVLLAAGCTSSDDGNGTSPRTPAEASRSAAAASAAAAVATGDLNTAVQELAKASYKYTMKVGDASGGGSVDPAAKQSSMSIVVGSGAEEFRTEVLIMDPELFTRISGLPLPGVDGKKWLRIDRSKIKSFAALGIQDIDDPTGVKTLAKTIATIQKTGDRSYQGTLDLSKGSAAFGLDEAAVRQLGEKARAIPFEATVNPAGKLATWKMTIPAYGGEKETTFDLTYTDHGGKFDLKKPGAAEIVNPPDAVYQMLQA